MRVIPKDKVIFHFNPTNPANYTVEDGETFWVECDDAIAVRSPTKASSAGY